MAACEPGLSLSPTLGRIQFNHGIEDALQLNVSVCRSLRPMDPAGT